MRMFKQFIGRLCSAADSVPFDTLVWIIVGSFFGIFVIAMALALKFAVVRHASKRPFLGIVNAFTALILVAFLSEGELIFAIVASVIFWLVGFLFYGLLCFLTSKPVKRERHTDGVAISAVPAAAPAPAPKTQIRGDIPAAKNSVRLEHAMSVTDRLLQKNLGKSDRQELEKLKNTLAVLQLKGTLSPAEAEILNDNFNALLKLMAKYNI